MRRIRKRITYANLASTLAIIIALGTGTAWAAGQLAPKSVGTKQLRSGAVTADKLRKNSVTTDKIKNGAVDTGKIANGAIVAAKIAAGAAIGEKIVNGAVTAIKIPDDSLTGGKVVEGSLSQVPSAASVNLAATAGSANPEAFAEVTKAGAVVAAGSKGIGSANVKAITPKGIYCVTVPGFVPRGVQATPLPRSKEEEEEDKEGPHGDVSVFATLFGEDTECPADQVEVRTYNAGTLKEEQFFFMAYR